MDVRKEINLASIELVRGFPFYGHILVQMPKIFITNESSIKIPTMGVGKDKKEDILVKLYVNDDYIRGLYEDHTQKKAFPHIIEVCKHEILHILFGHLAIDMPDKTRLGVAVDLAVNSYVNKDKIIKWQDPKTKMEYSQGCFADDYGLEPKKSALWYYNQLLKNGKYQEQCKNGSFGMGGYLSDVVNAHELWKKAKEDPMLQEMMKDLVRQAAKLCRETGRWGDIPSDLIEQIDDLTSRHKQLLPWQHILRLFVSSAMESMLNYTMRRRSKRFHTRPGIKKDEILNLAIGLDTSGSISDEQLKMFFHELYWISKNGCTITIFECDCTLQREYPYSKFDGKAAGRGGTDLEPILKEVEHRKFDALIYFTDFYAPPVSRRYDIPVLWILSNNSQTRDEFPYKWGKFIKIDSSMNVEVVP